MSKVEEVEEVEALKERIKVLERMNKEALNERDELRNHLHIVMNDCDGLRKALCDFIHIATNDYNSQNVENKVD